MLSFSLTSAITPVVNADSISNVQTSINIGGKKIESISIADNFTSPLQNPSIHAQNLRYKEGVTKVVSDGLNTTFYIKGSDCKTIIEGGSIVIGGYTSGALGVILGLAGLTSQNMIKGGIILHTEMVPDWNGAYHLTLISWSWQ